MTVYVDSSAFTTRYIDSEPSHERCVAIMDRHDAWATSRLTSIETARALSRARGRAGAAAYLAEFDADLVESLLIDLDRGVLAIAREVALSTGAKTLDAIHVASAVRLGDPDLEFLTFDVRQSQAATQMGLRLAR
ncbi:MAG: hypothetical protein JWM98_956 [Thermoleophilia bacterium]|nr:hypothetical protein [Thermoleophilia bacterium]